MEKNKEYIKLTDLTNEQPFKTPEGYFEMLEQQIFARIDEDENGKKAVGLLFYLKPILTIAACLVAAFLLVYFPIKISDQKTAENTTNTENIDILYFANSFIHESEVLEYLENTNQAEPIDDSTIESVLLASLTDIELIELN